MSKKILVKQSLIILLNQNKIKSVKIVGDKSFNIIFTIVTERGLQEKYLGTYSGKVASTKTITSAITKLHELGIKSFDVDLTAWELQSLPGHQKLSKKRQRYFDKNLSVASELVANGTNHAKLEGYSSGLRLILQGDSGENAQVFSLLPGKYFIDPVHAVYLAYMAGVRHIAVNLSEWDVNSLSNHNINSARSRARRIVRESLQKTREMLQDSEDKSA